MEPVVLQDDVRQPGEVSQGRWNGSREVLAVAVNFKVRWVIHVARVSGYRRAAHGGRSNGSPNMGLAVLELVGEAVP